MHQSQLIECIVPHLGRFLRELGLDPRPTEAGYWIEDCYDLRVSPGKGLVYAEGHYIGNLVTLWMAFQHPEWLEPVEPDSETNWRLACRDKGRLRKAWEELVQWLDRVYSGEPEPPSNEETERQARTEVRISFYFLLGLHEENYAPRWRTALQLRRAMEANCEAEEWESLQRDYLPFATATRFRQRLDQWVAMSENGACVSYDNEETGQRFGFRVEKRSLKQKTQYRVDRIEMPKPPRSPKVPDAPQIVRLREILSAKNTS